MHEESKQKISQLLDNDLDRTEALGLLQAIRKTPDLQNTLRRYEAISHALKTEKFLVPESDFSARLREKIRQEPAYLLQRRHIPSSPRFKAYATAASIAVVGIITGFYIRPSDNLTVPVATTGQTILLSASNKQPVNPPRQGQQDSINKQINEYLQAHNSSVYTNGQARFQLNARVTAYSQK